MLLAGYVLLARVWKLVEMSKLKRILGVKY